MCLQHTFRILRDVINILYRMQGLVFEFSEDSVTRVYLCFVPIHQYRISHTLGDNSEGRDSFPLYYTSQKNDVTNLLRVKICSFLVVIIKITIRMLRL